MKFDPKEYRKRELLQIQDLISKHLEEERSKELGDFLKLLDEYLAWTKRRIPTWIKNTLIQNEGGEWRASGYEGGRVHMVVTTRNDCFPIRVHAPVPTWIVREQDAPEAFTMAVEFVSKMDELHAKWRMDQANGVYTKMEEWG